MAAGLGMLAVALMAVLIWMGASTAFVLIFAAGTLAVQWWFSDSIALASMRAHVVTPEQAPQLHAMVDRLCALADMPKPRVGVSQLDMPNAFATGRSPDRSVVCVTTGILQTLDAEELEAVLAHELSHVAHRDVLVMTVASSAGIAAGLLALRWVAGGRRRNGPAADGDRTW